MKPQAIVLLTILLATASPGVVQANHIREGIPDEGTEYYPMGWVSFRLDATTAGRVVFENRVADVWDCSVEIDQLLGMAQSDCVPIDPPPTPFLTNNCGWINHAGYVLGSVGATNTGRSYCASDPLDAPSTSYTATSTDGTVAWDSDFQASTDGSPPVVDEDNPWVCKVTWTVGTVSSFGAYCLIDH